MSRDVDITALYATRRPLMHRRFDGGLTADEDAQLARIEAEIDALEMAEAAPAFAAMDALAQRAERLADEVRAVLARVEAMRRGDPR
jgi:hypothetical protein